MPRSTYTYIRQPSINLGSINSGGWYYPVQASNGALYVFATNILQDLHYFKSTDGGKTWSSAILFVGSINTVAVAIWYDRWTPGLTTDLIHVALTGSAVDDTFYVTLDTATDTISTVTTLFTGATTTGGGNLSITRARGGNVYCRVNIDQSTEGGFFRLPNANVPNGAWDAELTLNEALAVSDQLILMPGFGADNQDIILLFWDSSADEISRQNYDDSANTWSETSIATSMVDTTRLVSGPHMAACCHTTDSEILFVAWSDVDTLNSDLRFWTITDSAITEGTEVVLNSTDDQGACAIGYDATTNEIYVFYCGKSDGSETWYSSVNIYYKISSDGGTTWGEETQLTPYATSIPAIFCCPRTLSGEPLVMLFDYTVLLEPNWFVVSKHGQPCSQSMIVM